MTTCAARRAGISSGCSEWTTSSGPASHSTGGQSSRCQARLSSRTGIADVDAARAPGRPTAGQSRSFHELEKSVSESSAIEPAAERGGEFVDVLADAGALPERRPVVEQDAHAARIVAQRESDGKLLTSQSD